MAFCLQKPLILLLIFLQLFVTFKTLLQLDPSSSTATSTPPPPKQPTCGLASLFTPAPPPFSSSDLPDQLILSNASLLAPILSHLGFNELATVAPSLASDDSAARSGPLTIFAPSDSSLRSCSVPVLLREHAVPGLFTIDYLRKISVGRKIETLSRGRCITITSSSPSHRKDTLIKVFIGGAEIANPDLFNNGLIIVHGIRGYVSPSLSCDVKWMRTWLFCPFHRSNQQIIPTPEQQQQFRSFSLTSLLLKAAMRNYLIRNNEIGWVWGLYSVFVAIDLWIALSCLWTTIL